MTLPHCPRRATLKTIAALGTSTLLLAVAGPARADKNAALRTALKYQDTPKDGHQCDGCLQFVPGKSAKDPGGCKAMPGDTEIAAAGWCMAFVAKK